MIRMAYFEDDWNILMMGLLTLNISVVIAHLSIHKESTTTD